MNENKLHEIDLKVMKDLISERDRLQSSLKIQDAQVASLLIEIDKLKVELEKHISKVRVEIGRRTLAESRCARLEEENKRIFSNSKATEPPHEGLQLSSEFPIGDIRRQLFITGTHPWNAIVRGVTADLELKWSELQRGLEAKDGGKR